MLDESLELDCTINSLIKLTVVFTYYEVSLFCFLLCLAKCQRNHCSKKQIGKFLRVCQIMESEQIEQIKRQSKFEIDTRDYCGGE